MSSARPRTLEQEKTSRLPLFAGSSHRLPSSDHLGSPVEPQREQGSFRSLHTFHPDRRIDCRMDRERKFQGEYSHLAIDPNRHEDTSENGFSILEQVNPSFSISSPPPSLSLFSRDAQTFVQTIDSCISSRAATTVEWRANPTERTTASIRRSEPVYASPIAAQPPRLAASRSFHVLLPSTSNRNTDHPRRSPSPIWKRRTTPVRKPAIPTNVRRKTMRNSTDC